MKRFFTRQQALFVGGLLICFVLGSMVVWGRKTTALAQTSPLPFCTGTKSCQTGLLSIYSKDKIERAPTGQKVPAGFCLSIPIILYHHIQPEAVAKEKGQTSLTVDNGMFEQQMAYLAQNGYTTLTADQLVTAIQTHTQLPGKQVVITMDDGYLDNYIYAFPVLQKYHLITNLMVPTGLLGITAGTNAYYTWDNLKEMVGSGLAFAYNHTWSHFSLPGGNADKDTFEITTAQNQLQQHLGKISPIFTYPYGSGATLGWVVDLLKSKGYIAAFSTLPGRFDCDSNIMALPRIHIGNAPLSSYGI
jgi:peptidoglycan/xylan/chitin deacetylase (PgdA/CDA1 family)